MSSIQELTDAVAKLKVLQTEIDNYNNEIRMNQEQQMASFETETIDVHSNTLHMRLPAIYTEEYKNLQKNITTVEEKIKLLNNNRNDLVAKIILLQNQHLINP